MTPDEARARLMKLLGLEPRDDGSLPSWDVIVADLEMTVAAERSSADRALDSLGEHAKLTKSLLAVVEKADAHWKAIQFDCHDRAKRFTEPRLAQAAFAYVAERMRVMRKTDPWHEEES